MNNISLQKLEVGEIANSSGVFSGENTMHYWKHQSKRNEGFGTILGDGNQLSHSITILEDPDTFDFLNTKKKE
ncbi:hypothetical protein MK805_06625 [Shimazuella sp. AN120528]|uniref:hypothetical protein n=1 Tax=Shimazuella soli TaxID=1892854 RepID=UPI001F115034|nr:hypothetical protein [Shimazuella soli]MCH5584643.1 hypothetical protein [Shimazuella soli]